MSDPMISVRGLWKVYGHKAERIVGSPEADLPRRELEAKTGCVVAMRDITAGEVLTFDRAMTESSDLHDVECQCGSDECRGKVTAEDWMLPELQLRYRGFFSPYLARRISSLVSVGAERRAFAL